MNYTEKLFRSRITKISMQGKKLRNVLQKYWKLHKEVILKTKSKVNKEKKIMTYKK